MFRFSQRLILCRNCSCLPAFYWRPRSQRHEAETGNGCASRRERSVPHRWPPASAAAATAERPSVDTFRTCASRRCTGLRRNCGRVSLRMQCLAAEAEGVVDPSLYTSSEPSSSSKSLIMSTSSSLSQSFRTASAQLETTLCSEGAHRVGGVEEMNSGGATWMSDTLLVRAPFVCK